MKPGAFDPSEFTRTLERVAQGADAGNVNHTPVFDAVLRKHIAEDAIQGRKIEDYRMALERQGFSYVPAHTLPPYNNGRLRQVGEWRNARLSLAFTEEDILSEFPSPEEFFRWAQAFRIRKAAGARGLGGSLNRPK